jgi:ketosteroid isomerase-like protein
MRLKSGFCALAMILSSTPLFAQGSADDQAAVWTAVETLWSADERGDSDWVDSMLSADFMGWPSESPAPRSKASTRMWARFNADLGKKYTYELYPLSIVVHGDVAIVHYLYTMASQRRDKTVESENGRYTDVLVRDGASWKFLSWHGGQANP